MIFCITAVIDKLDTNKTCLHICYNVLCIYFIAIYSRMTPYISCILYSLYINTLYYIKYT